jgi:site-specific DNA recombinase
MKTAALYIRVSTEEQVNGYSIDAQTEKLRAYCVAKDLSISREFVDPGLSGSTMERPELQLMIATIRNYDYVVVFKLDRLSRSQKDTLHMIEDVFIPNNVSLVSITESFDTGTAFGKAMIGMLSVFAQLERNSITERFMMGREARAKSGKHNGQLWTPIGYDKSGDGIVENEYEAMQVRSIFSQYIGGKGIDSIRMELASSGFKHKYGEWNSTTVRSIISNPIYAGFVQFKKNRFPGNHDRIVTPEEFAEAEKIKTSRNGAYAGSKNLYAGIMFCEYCGGRLFAHKSGQNKYVYYLCHSAYGGEKHSKQYMKRADHCQYKTKREDEINAYFDLFMPTIPDIIKESAKKEMRKNSDADILKRKSASLDEQIDKLVDLYQLSKSQQTMDKIKDRIGALDKEREALSKHEPHESKDIKKMIEESHEAKGWHAADKDQRRKLLFQFIDRVTVGNEVITVTLRDV